MGFISNEQAKKVGIKMDHQEFSKNSNVGYGKLQYANEDMKIHHENLFKNNNCPCRYCLKKMESN